MVKRKKRAKKSTPKRRQAKMTSFEKSFAAKYVKKGGLPEFRRVLKSRWWIGRLGSKKRPRMSR